MSSNPMDESADSRAFSAPDQNASPVGQAASFSEPDARAEQQNPVQLRAITVKRGRMICELTIPVKRYRYSTPRLAAFVEGQYPELAHHACVNETGPAFGYVIESTSTAHLLEHLVISEQTRAATDSSAEFVGTTEWVDEAAGLARVQVSFRDDLEALRAFGEATRFLNMAVLTCLA